MFNIKCLKTMEDKEMLQKEVEDDNNSKKELKFSSLSFKMEKEESKSNINNNIEKEFIGKNIIISKINNKWKMIK